VENSSSSCAVALVARFRCATNAIRPHAQLLVQSVEMLWPVVPSPG